GALLAIMPPILRHGHVVLEVGAAALHLLLAEQQRNALVRDPATDEARVARAGRIAAGAAGPDRRAPVALGRELVHRAVPGAEAVDEILPRRRAHVGKAGIDGLEAAVGGNRGNAERSPEGMGQLDAVQRPPE